MLSPPPTEPRQVVSWYPSNGYMHTGREKTDSERKEAVATEVETRASVGGGCLGAVTTKKADLLLVKNA